ncbi:uncharacterized protein [Montipora capricornis]|uniref:uncharacterized protein n=1 Tax=Montipora capricornis TaxID=246305 RepID=UPI0035F1B8ED
MEALLSRRELKRKRNLDNALDRQWQKLEGVLSSIDLHILKKVKKKRRTQVVNISSYKLCDEELDILKFGLTFAIKPPHVSKSQVFTTFELLHDDLKRHLSDKTKANEVRNEIQHLATRYVNSFKPSMNDLKKHKILKRLKHNKDIIILRPDKGNGVVVLDKVVYNKAMVDLLRDNSKFKIMECDLTLRREEIQQFDFSDKFLVSYDVTSLFTNIPLSETIDLAVNAIIDGLRNDSDFSNVDGLGNFA